MTEAVISEIYSLGVEIPTNQEIARIDHDDEVYRTSSERMMRLLSHILECRSR